MGEDLDQSLSRLLGIERALYMERNSLERTVHVAASVELSGIKQCLCSMRPWGGGLFLPVLDQCEKLLLPLRAPSDSLRCRLSGNLIVCNLCRAP